MRFDASLSSAGRGPAVGLGHPAGRCSGRPAVRAPEALDPSHVAVLYFDDYSPDQPQGHVAGGLTEALIHELSQIEALSVVSRNGVKPYRDGTTPFDTIVRTLGVGSVVEGSVERYGDRLVVTFQLVDASPKELSSGILLHRIFRS